MTECETPNSEQNPTSLTSFPWRFGLVKCFEFYLRFDINYLNKKINQTSRYLLSLLYLKRIILIPYPKTLSSQKQTPRLVPRLTQDQPISLDGLVSVFSSVTLVCVRGHLHLMSFIAMCSVSATWFASPALTPAPVSCRKTLGCPIQPVSTIHQQASPQTRDGHS